MAKVFTPQKHLLWWRLQRAVIPTGVFCDSGGRGGNRKRLGILTADGSLERLYVSGEPIFFNSLTLAHWK